MTYLDVLAVKLYLLGGQRVLGEDLAGFVEHQLAGGAQQGEVIVSRDEVGHRGGREEGTSVVWITFSFAGFLEPRCVCVCMCVCVCVCVCECVRVCVCV